MASMSFAVQFSHSRKSVRKKDNLLSHMHCFLHECFLICLASLYKCSNDMWPFNRVFFFFFFFSITYCTYVDIQKFKNIYSDYWNALVISLITAGGVIELEEVWQAHFSRLFQVRSLREVQSYVLHRHMYYKSSKSYHRYNTLEEPLYHLLQRSHNPLIMTALWSLQHSDKARAIKSLLGVPVLLLKK